VTRGTASKKSVRLSGVVVARSAVSSVDPDQRADNKLSRPSAEPRGPARRSFPVKAQ